MTDALRDDLTTDQRRPSTASFTPGAVLPTDYDTFLFSVDPFDPASAHEFAEFIGRLRIRIVYASRYGDHSTVDWARDADRPQA